MSNASAKRIPATASGPPKGVLISVAWFPGPAPRAQAGPGAILVRMVIGAAAGGVLFKLGHTTVAIVAWALTGLVGALSLASPRARDAIANGLARFGRAVGNGVGTVLLTLVYLLALTPARLLKRLAGSDDLRLKDQHLPSYYEPCDAPERKVRYAGTMFATEVLRPRRGSLAVLLLSAFVLLGIAEAVLRTKGFGPAAVVYRSEPLSGYFPAPNQRVDRYGGRVYVNNLGMRAPNFEPHKAEGTFRVLMLGDSTLWGGSYVDQDALYARLLDRKLNDVANGGRVEVLNMGVNGWGPFHERGFVDAFGTFGADLVLVCLPHDDLDRDHYTLMSLPYFSESHPPRLALEEVMMHTMWRYRRQMARPDRAWRAKQRELGLAEYESLAVLLKEGGAGEGASEHASEGANNSPAAEVFFELLPSRAVGLRIAPWDLDAARVEVEVVERLTRMLAAHAIPAHYPAGLFAGKGNFDDLYHDDVHLHWKGHAIYADFLFEQITRSSRRFAKWAADQRATKAR